MTNSNGVNEEVVTTVGVKRKFFTKKKIIWGSIILLVLIFIGYKIFKPKDLSGSIQTDIVRKQDIKRTVLSTGQVVSQIDLSLSFKASGVIQKMNSKEGDAAKEGDVLATLDQRDQLASLTTARGSLAQAQANYQKVLAGASNEDIAVMQVALDNAKSTLETTTEQQKVLVANAYSTLLNTGLDAIPSSGNAPGTTATITGSYAGVDQGMYKISIYATGAGLRYQVSGLESAEGYVDITPQPLGTKGLYIQFSSTLVPVNNVWTVSIPNNQAALYVSSYNAYQSAIQNQRAAIASAKNAIASAQAALDLKKSQARPADVAAAQAQIISAEGQVQAAAASLENTVIRAPANGTITKVVKKVGEQATAMQEVIVLQDVSMLHIEADVSEANIADLKPGQVIDMTFGALGPDRHFTSKVQTVNPASSLSSGVVNYKVVASFEGVPEIKPGMTADLTILTAQKSGALTVPLRAIINRNGKKYVRVIDDSKKKTYHEVEVSTGLEADGGLVELTAGLSEGQEIVTFIKQ
jgi:HlyD family secretion protein